MMTSIPFQIPQPPISLQLHVGYHLIEGDFLINLCKQYGNKVVIITDPSLKQLYGDKLSQKLSACLFEIPVGEKAKTREVKQVIEDQMLRAGCGRDTVVIGLGGGSTTDLAGFIASTYLRGVSLILIPTSLLAMVDAAIGGKTAVDTSFGKNLIGTFYHPQAIVTDLEVLNTLPDKEKINGFSEIIKMGLIFDPHILPLIDHPDSLEELVIRASKAKMAIITQDPYETSGLRRILNFGHTIGHALESVSNFELSHGEAVAIGCIIESYLSTRLGYLSEQDFTSIKSIYTTAFNSLRLPKKYQRQALLEAMAFDKKKSAAGIRFVLIDRIGHAFPFDGEYCRTVPLQELESAISYMEQQYG